MKTETIFYDPNSKQSVTWVINKIEKTYDKSPIVILTGVGGMQMLYDHDLLEQIESRMEQPKSKIIYMPYFDNTLVFGLRDSEKSMFPTSSYAIYVLYGYDIEMRFLHKDEKQYIEI